MAVREKKSSLTKAWRPSSDTVDMVFAPTSTAPHARRLQFGSVTVAVTQIVDAELRRNIKSGQRALKRACAVLVQPGVELKLAPGIPRFHADPKEPARVVRVLNGKRATGVFEGGEFKVHG